MSAKNRGYNDLQDHLDQLRSAGLLQEINEPIDKDSEMHPLVRWQFRGGIPENRRKAFLFTNITDGKGKTFDIPVVVGAMAASQDIYSIGMGTTLERIGEKWKQAIANPIGPQTVNEAPCQEIVMEGDDLIGPGNGLDKLPIPISTPGFDSAPTLTATNVITRDPETNIQNMGTYRAGLKSANRLVVRMATRVGGAGGFLHWKKYKARGEQMPVAIVLGCPPYVAFMGPQKMPIGVDEYDIAGGLAEEPINVIPGKTVDLLVPAEAEIIIEGLIDTNILEPEGPFGESHGHVALEEFNMPMTVTAITQKKRPVIPSYISQVTPSESSVIKRVAYEPLFLHHLQKELNILGVKGVSLHEPLTSLLRVTIISMDEGASETEIWRALYGAASFKGDFSKIVIAVNPDIDPNSADAILWAISYRSNPQTDVFVMPHRGQGHGPKREHTGEQDSTLLINATMKSKMPPLALPTRPYMEKAKELWERLGLEDLKPESPWHGYSLGDWSEQWEQDAQRAVQGNYLINGLNTLKRQIASNVTPETSVRDVEEGWGENQD